MRLERKPDRPSARSERRATDYLQARRRQLSSPTLGGAASGWLTSDLQAAGDAAASKQRTAESDVRRAQRAPLRSRRACERRLDDAQQRVGLNNGSDDVRVRDEHRRGSGRSKRGEVKRFRVEGSAPTTSWLVSLLRLACRMQDYRRTCTYLIELCHRTSSQLRPLSRRALSKRRKRARRARTAPTHYSVTRIASGKLACPLDLSRNDLKGENGLQGSSALRKCDGR